MFTRETLLKHSLLTLSLHCPPLHSHSQTGLTSTVRNIPTAIISTFSQSVWVIQPATFGQQTNSVHFRAGTGLFEGNLSETLLILQSDCGLAPSPLLEVDAVIRLVLTVDHWSNPDCRLHINLTVSVWMCVFVSARVCL